MTGKYNDVLYPEGLKGIFFKKRYLKIASTVLSLK